MKKLMTLICALFCMAQVYAANPVKQWGQLQVKGAQLCDQSGNPVVLKACVLGIAQLASVLQQKCGEMACARLACQHHQSSHGNSDRRQLSGKSRLCSKMHYPGGRCRHQE